VSQGPHGTQSLLADATVGYLENFDFQLEHIIELYSFFIFIYIYSYYIHIIFILCSFSKSGKSSSFRFFLPYMFFTSWTHGLVLGLDSSLVSFPGHLSLIVMRFWQLDFTNVRTHAWAKQWSP
jgi:hypothetical protein